MRLSDLQYKVLTRTGLAIVIASALTYDRVPTGYEHLILAMAIVGAAIGFFPLFTTDAFRQEPTAHTTHEEALEESEVPLLRESSARQVMPSQAAEVVHLSARRLELHMEQLYRTIRLASDKTPRYALVYNSDDSLTHLEPFGTSDLNAVRERSKRLQEMHELIHGLTGIPQEFSVELTGSNSIIVRCEKPKESANIVQQMTKNWGHQTFTQKETVH